MASSMTGFGRGMVKGKHHKFWVEIRSVNSRYCEVRVQSPKEQLALEHFLSQRVREVFSRGKFDLLVKTEPLRSKATLLDHEKVKEVWKELESLRKKLGIPSPTSLDLALSFMKNHTESNEEEKETFSLFQKAAEKAFLQLQKFRDQEGAHLIQDIRSRAKKISSSLFQIQKSAEKVQIEKRKVFQERAQELLGGFSNGAKTLEVEVAQLVEKFDISEEVVRLQGHVKKLNELISQKGSVGRELDFLIQELNREINTIGSKAGNGTITHEVIFVKSEIEKIREQAQNLE